jgi:hypothetical protein
MTPQRCEFWWPRVFVRLLSFTLKDPVFEHDIRCYKLAELIDQKSPLEVSELECIESLKLRNKTKENIERIFRWLSITLFVRALVYCYFMLVKYNTFAKESRLVIDHNTNHDDTGQPQLYSFACLASNCSSLVDPLLNATRSRLIMDELPVFSICQKFLSMFNEPFQHINLLGVYLMLLSASVHAIGLVLSLELSRCRTKCPLLLFWVAPNISRRLAILRIEKHIGNLRRSFCNYQQMIWAERLKRNRIISMNPIRVVGVHAEPGARSSFRAGSERLGASRLDPDCPSCWDERKFVDDCLPIVRFEHWRRKMDTIFIMFALLFSVMMIALVVAVLWTLDLYLDKKVQAMAEFQAEINRSGCSIWRQQTNEQIKPAGLQCGFGTYNVLSLIVIIVLWPCWTVSAPAHIVLVNSWEVRCLICELKYKIIMLLPVIKNMTDAMLRERAHFGQVDHHVLHPCRRNLLDDNWRVVGGRQVSASWFKFERLTEKFGKDIRVVYFSIVNRPLLSYRLRLETQAFIMNECLGDRFKSSAGLAHWPSTLAELLEKLYVQYRFFDDLLSETDPSNSVVTGTSSSLCYVVFLVNLIMCKNTGSISVEQYVIMPATLITAIMLTLNSALIRSKVSCCPRPRGGPHLMP